MHDVASHSTCIGMLREELGAFVQLKHEFEKGYDMVKMLRGEKRCLEADVLEKLDYSISSPQIHGVVVTKTVRTRAMSLDALEEDISRLLDQ